MSKSNSRERYRARLSLALLGVMGLVIWPDHSWSHRVSAESEIRQENTPGWSLTGSLNTPRQDYTATPLPDGKVLVAGGGSGCPYGSLNSTEIYDPATGTWSYAGTLVTPRRGHSATHLGGGFVLVAGGESGTDQFLSSVELFDPVSRTWRLTGGMNSIMGPVLIAPLDSGRVLAVSNGGIVAKAEIRDPETEIWSETGSPNDIAFGQLTFLRADATLLVGNGLNPTHPARAQIFDHDTGVWNATGSLNTIREINTVTRISNGRILVTGAGARDDFRTHAEVYDPTNGTWVTTGAPSKWGKTMRLLTGKVLIATADWAELYDPVTGTWGSTTSLNLPQSFSTATMLPNFTVLFTSETGCGPDGQTAALFDFRLAPSGPVSSVSAASYSRLGLASEGLAAAFSSVPLATSTSEANTLPLPTQLAGTRVLVTDSAGVTRRAPLYFVSPTQVNYQIPPETAAGVADVVVRREDDMLIRGVAVVNVTAPGIFTANADGQGVPAALVLRVKVDGSESYEPVAEFDAVQNKFIPRPIDLGPEGEQVYLVLFGTGIRHRRSLTSVKVWIDMRLCEVTFAGAQSEFTGLDQVNVLLPRSLVGRGEVGIWLVVENGVSNPTRLNIK